MMIMSTADNRCAICRGEESTSTTRCQCPAPTRCINCGDLTTSSLCTRCETLPRCQRCKRHLPRCCFLLYDDDNVSDSSEATDKRPATVCRACDKKRSQSTVHKSTGSVVTEIEIPTTDAVHRSFENFLRIHEDQTRTRVDEFRQLHR